MADIGKICPKQAYCSDCPCRSNCCIRQSFYDDYYQSLIEEAIVTTVFLSSSRGIPMTQIALWIPEAMETMNKKREREIEEHPTYSSN